MIAPSRRIGRGNHRVPKRRLLRISRAPAEIEAGVKAMADEVWAWCEKHQVFGTDDNSQGQIRRLPARNPEPDLAGARLHARATV